MNMGRRLNPLLALVLITALLFLSFPRGFARRVEVMRTTESWQSSVPIVPKGDPRTSGRMIAETETDYQDPTANTNPRNGALLNSPSPPPPPPTH